MFIKFDEPSRKVLLGAKLNAKRFNHTYIGTEHVVLSILENENYAVTKTFTKYNVFFDNYKKKLLEIVGIGSKENDANIYTPLLKHILEETEILSKDQNKDEITLNEILSSIFEEGEGIALRVIALLDVNIEALFKEFVIKKNKKNNKKKYAIEEYGMNLNKMVELGKIDPVIGREKELERIIEILCRRTKNNPILIGPAGVGKTAIVEELSRRIVEGSVPLQLKSKKIISISIASLVSGTKYRGEFEERITKILNELELSSDIILFIDEIHTLVGAGGAEGAIDAANILKPFLARGTVKIIGATTIDEYKKYFEDDKALERRFQRVVVNEPKEEDILSILVKLRPIYEKYHGVKINDDILKNISVLSDRYIYDRKQPDKSIDILDEVCAKTSLKKSKKTLEIDNLKEQRAVILKEKNLSLLKKDFLNASNLRRRELELTYIIQSQELKTKGRKNNKNVLLSTLAEVLKDKSNMPIYELINDDLKNLSKLETKLSRIVVGQDKIIKEICKDLKKIKLGYKVDNKPRSYMFAGPTGVGKTLLASEISKLILNENSLIRLDMSEYKEPHSISKIIGSPPGYVGFSNKKTVLDEVKLNPNAIILLDEIEKANNDVLNLFLQVLDEGKIKTSNNEEIRFDNNIIIMTSNLGFKKGEIGFFDTQNENVFDSIKSFLGVEFMNRIDKTFLFKKLTRDDIKKITISKINSLLKKLNKSNNIKLKKAEIDAIVSKSKFEEYGARKLDTIIFDEISDKLVEEKLKKGTKITIETT